MANKRNGEVPIEIDGTTYTMALTLDAMVAVEELLSTPQKAVTFSEVMLAADRGSAKHLRALLWAVLQTHHSEIKITDVSALVQKAGGLGMFEARLTELAKASQPDPEDLKALGSNQNPRHAQAAKSKPNGTGGLSTSEPVS